MGYNLIYFSFLLGLLIHSVKGNLNCSKPVCFPKCTMQAKTLAALEEAPSD